MSSLLHSDNVKISVVYFWLFIMKVVLAVVAIVAFAKAELPPSNSYLPPSPVSRSTGYFQGPQPTPPFPGAPQVLAARNVDQAAHGRGNGFSRISPHDLSIQGRLGVASPGIEDNSVALGPNDIDTSAAPEPANYNFGYMVNDLEGTDFGHHEERLEEKAQGEYHVVLPDGRKQTVSYEADERGFKPQISYQDMENLDSSVGYDINAKSPKNNKGYKTGGNGYQNGGHGYQNGGHGYQNGGNGYKNGGHADTRSY